MNEWINSKELEAPAYSPILFVADDKYNGIITRYGFRGKYDYKAFEADNEVICYPFSYVTHWMPLPEPPRMEE